MQTIKNFDLLDMQEKLKTYSKRVKNFRIKLLYSIAANTIKAIVGQK